MNLPLMSIKIGIDPDVFEIGTFVLTWHGFLTFIAVAVAVFLVGRWAKKEGMVTDAVYSVAVWAIIGGIVVSRAFHVIDFWDQFYRDDPVRIIQVWNGGVTIYGAILGGFLFGAAYMVVRNHPRFLGTWNSLFKGAKLERAPLPPVGRLADLATPALLIAMAIGRVGDVINGEHFAKVTSLPWGFTYSHEKTQQLYASSGLNSLSPTHPEVVYEILLDIAILAVVWALKDRLRPHGMLFAFYLASYSLGRFFLSYLRLDRDWAIGLNEAQYVALVVLVITGALLLTKAQFVKAEVVTRARSGRPRAKR